MSYMCYTLQLFEKVKAQRKLSSLHEKITVVNGDILLPGFDLSAEDRKMLCENVDIVYHVAATVRYHDKNIVIDIVTSFSTR